MKNLLRESQSDFQNNTQVFPGMLEAARQCSVISERKYVLCSVNLNLVKDIHHNCVPNQPCQDKVLPGTNSSLEQSSVRHVGTCSTLNIISMLMLTLFCVGFKRTKFRYYEYYAWVIGVFERHVIIRVWILLWLPPTYYLRLFYSPMMSGKKSSRHDIPPLIRCWRYKAGKIGPTGIGLNSCV